VTELERLAATVLTQWRAEGGSDGGPIAVGALLDRVLPYRQARRLLGIDISEDYEALLLRLLAEEEGLVSVLPLDAAEKARSTLSSKLPDLDVLQQLRAAEITLRGGTVTRLEGVLQMPPARISEPEPVAPAAVTPSHDDAPAVAYEEPVDDIDIIPLPVSRVVADAIRVALESPDPTDPAPPPPEFLTKVQFMPPSMSCWSCSEGLPEGRSVKFCPFCGADQRPPACPACNGAVERHWKHCPDCGVKLGP
jgi:hypothetical protein